MVDVVHGHDHVATELVEGWDAAGERVAQIARTIRSEGFYRA